MKSFKKNKKKLYFGLVLGGLSFIFLLAIKSAEAANIFEYKLLESIPFVGQAGASVGLPAMIVGIYQFGIATVGIAALFMLSVGGFMYVTSAGNTSTAGSAKGIIVDSLLGLFIALISWGLLNIINPDLVGPGAANPSLFSGSISSNTSTTEASPEETAIAGEFIKSGSLPELATQVKDRLGAKLSTSGTCKDKNGKIVSPASNIDEVINGEPMTVCNSDCPRVACVGKVVPNEAMLKAIVGISGQITKVTSIAGGAHGKDSMHYKGQAVDLVFSGSEKSWQPHVDTLVKSYGALERQTFCDKNGKAARIGGVAGGQINCSGVTVDGLDADHIHADFRNN